MRVESCNLILIQLSNVDMSGKSMRFHQRSLLWLHYVLLLLSRLRRKLRNDVTDDHPLPRLEGQMLMIMILMIMIIMNGFLRLEGHASAQLPQPRTARRPRMPPGPGGVKPVSVLAS